MILTTYSASSAITPVWDISKKDYNDLSQKISLTCKTLSFEDVKATIASNDPESHAMLWFKWQLDDIIKRQVPDKNSPFVNILAQTIHTLSTPIEHRQPAPPQHDPLLWSMKQHIELFLPKHTTYTDRALLRNAQSIDELLAYSRLFVGVQILSSPREHILLPYLNNSNTHRALLSFCHRYLSNACLLSEPPLSHVSTNIFDAKRVTIAESLSEGFINYSSLRSNHHVNLGLQVILYKKTKGTSVGKTDEHSITQFLVEIAQSFQTPHLHTRFRESILYATLNLTLTAIYLIKYIPQDSPFLPLILTTHQKQPNINSQMHTSATLSIAQAAVFSKLNHKIKGIDKTLQKILQDGFCSWKNSQLLHQHTLSESVSVPLILSLTEPVEKEAALRSIAASQQEFFNYVPHSLQRRLPIAFNAPTTNGTFMAYTIRDLWRSIDRTPLNTTLSKAMHWLWLVNDQTTPKPPCGFANYTKIDCIDFLQTLQQYTNLSCQNSIFFMHSIVMAVALAHKSPAHLKALQETNLSFFPTNWKSSKMGMLPTLYFLQADIGLPAKENTPQHTVTSLLGLRTHVTNPSMKTLCEAGNIVNMHRKTRICLVRDITINTLIDLPLEAPNALESCPPESLPSFTSNQQKSLTLNIPLEVSTNDFPPFATPPSTAISSTNTQEHPQFTSTIFHSSSHHNSPEESDQNLGQGHLSPTTLDTSQSFPPFSTEISTAIDSTNMQESLQPTSPPLNISPSKLNCPIVMPTPPYCSLSQCEEESDLSYLRDLLFPARKGELLQWTPEPSEEPEDLKEDPSKTFLFTPESIIKPHKEDSPKPRSTRKRKHTTESSGPPPSTKKHCEIVSVFDLFPQNAIEIINETGVCAVAMEVSS